MAESSARWSKGMSSQTRLGGDASPYLQALCRSGVDAEEIQDANGFGDCLPAQFISELQKNFFRVQQIILQRHQVALGEAR
jgi:hypothetical protein